jgi:hypothetical protein
MSETYTPDNLIAGLRHRVTETVTDVLSGEGVLARGTVVGRVEVVLGTAAAGTNTGNGTIGSVALNASGPVKVGTYTATNIVAVGNGGLFEVKDPEGRGIGIARVGVLFVGPGIQFTIADGATDFIVGDSFTIPITVGSLKLKKAALAATDGSQRVYGVIAEEVDATSADAEAVVYLTGEFNEDALTFGTGLTKTNTKEEARAKGIHYVEVKNNAVVA